jgi:hypothetical protein
MMSWKRNNKVWPCIKNGYKKERALELKFKGNRSMV